jgi:hypothetical protein
VERQSKLLEIVLALGAAGSLARLLNRREQKPDEHANDGNDNQEFDQREPAAGSHMVRV